MSNSLTTFPSLNRCGKHEAAVDALHILLVFEDYEDLLPHPPLATEANSAGSTQRNPCHEGAAPGEHSSLTGGCASPLWPAVQGKESLRPLKNTKQPHHRKDGVTCLETNAFQ